MQAFGLSQPKFILGGTLTGAAADYWDVLWPQATNTVSVGFLLRSRSPHQLQPTQVILCSQCWLEGLNGHVCPCFCLCTSVHCLSI